MAKIEIPAGRQRVCENCAFFERDSEESTLMGECKRYAPKPWNGEEGVLQDFIAKWPSVCISEWCGEHEIIREQ